jgi:hypothetical protein
MNSGFLEFWDKKCGEIQYSFTRGNECSSNYDHKSKGLNFQLLFFPFAEEDYNSENQKTSYGSMLRRRIFRQCLIDNSTAVVGFGEGQQRFSIKTGRIVG